MATKLIISSDSLCYKIMKVRYCYFFDKKIDNVEDDPHTMQKIVEEYLASQAFYDSLVVDDVERKMSGRSWERAQPLKELYAERGDLVFRHVADR